MELCKLEKAFNDWHQLIYNYVYLRLQNQSAAEDIVQEVFFKAWRSRDTFNPKKSSLKNWLFKIATNAIYDHLKKNPSFHQELPEEIETDESIHQEVQKQEQANAVFNKIQELPARDQELLILHYKNELKIVEIAEILEIEESACKTALHRARQKLKEKCKDM